MFHQQTAQNTILLCALFLALSTEQGAAAPVNGNLQKRTIGAGASLNLGNVLGVDANSALKADSTGMGVGGNMNMNILGTPFGFGINLGMDKGQAKLPSTSSGAQSVASETDNNAQSNNVGSKPTVSGTSEPSGAMQALSADLNKPSSQANEASSESNTGSNVSLIQSAEATDAQITNEKKVSESVEVPTSNADLQQNASTSDASRGENSSPASTIVDAGAGQDGQVSSQNTEAQQYGNESNDQGVESAGIQAAKTYGKHTVSSASNGKGVESADTQAAKTSGTYTVTNTSSSGQFSSTTTTSSTSSSRENGQYASNASTQNGGSNQQAATGSQESHVGQQASVVAGQGTNGVILVNGKPCADKKPLALGNPVFVAKPVAPVTPMVEVVRVPKRPLCNCPEDAIYETRPASSNTEFQASEQGGPAIHVPTAPAQEPAAGTNDQSEPIETVHVPQISRSEPSRFIVKSSRRAWMAQQAQQTQKDAALSEQVSTLYIRPHPVARRVASQEHASKRRCVRRNVKKLGYVSPASQEDNTNTQYPADATY